MLSGKVFQVINCDTYSIFLQMNFLLIRFFRKDHLAEHMATHSKLLPFRCPICNKVSWVCDCD